MYVNSPFEVCLSNYTLHLDVPSFLATLDAPASTPAESVLAWDTHERGKERERCRERARARERERDGERKTEKTRDRELRQQRGLARTRPPHLLRNRSVHSGCRCSSIHFLKVCLSNYTLHSDVPNFLATSDAPASPLAKSVLEPSHPQPTRLRKTHVYTLFLCWRMQLLRDRYSSGARARKRERLQESDGERERHSGRATEGETERDPAKESSSSGVGHPGRVHASSCDNTQGPITIFTCWRRKLVHNWGVLVIVMHSCSNV